MERDCSPNTRHAPYRSIIILRVSMGSTGGSSERRQHESGKNEADNILKHRCSSMGQVGVLRDLFMLSRITGQTLQKHINFLKMSDRSMIRYLLYCPVVGSTGSSARSNVLADMPLVVYLLPSKKP